MCAADRAGAINSISSRPDAPDSPAVRVQTSDGDARLCDSATFEENLPATDHPDNLFPFLRRDRFAERK